MTEATAATPLRFRKSLLNRLLGRRFGTTSGTTWAVQATVDEPTELLCAFAAHYLDLGAAEVILHLDNPRADQIAILRSVRGVRVIPCNRVWWLRRRRKRPRTHVRRQWLNSNHAYRHCRADWLLTCDADEFLLPDRPMAEILAGTDPETQYLRIGMAERIFRSAQPPQTIFDGLFRLPLFRRQKLARQVYGDSTRFLHHGLTADSVGKCMLRTGYAAQMWLHYPYPRGYQFKDAEVRRMLKQPFHAELKLLHFDGLTPLHWRLKLMRKLLRGRPLSERTLDNNRGRTPERRTQLEAVFSARQDPAALAALQELQSLTEAQIATLDRHKALLPVTIDPVAQALRRFPGAGLDFTAARFDAELHRLYPEALATLATTDGGGA